MATAKAQSVLDLAQAAKEAARRIAGASTGAKNAALLAYARARTEAGRCSGERPDLASRATLPPPVGPLGLDAKRMRDRRGCNRGASGQ
jgi:hypothetical protein